MGFESRVAVQEDGDYWRLLMPLVYSGNTDRFVVPTGFRTDFASVPRWATWLIPRTGRHNRAAVLHDYLCRQSRELRPVFSGPGPLFHYEPVISRKDADGIFLRVLRELDVPEWRARLMYWGVRVGSYLYR